MKIHQLPKTTTRSKKIVGRGIGSGKGGHTTGRGNKGQKARERVPLTMEGTKFKKSLIKRIPFQRGKNKFKTLTTNTTVLNLSALAELPDGFEVTVENLIKKNLVPEKTKAVKILGDGEIKTKLVVRVPTSVSATKKIEKAGGTVDTT